MTELAGDAHAETMTARGKVATRVLTVYRVYNSVMTNPGAPQELKARIKTAGAALFADFAGQNAAKFLAKKQTQGFQADLDQAHSDNARLTQDLSVGTARKDLQIKYLQGETLRPDDLDGVLSKKDDAATTDKSAATGKGRQSSKAALASAPPKGQGRRRSSPR